MFVEFLYMVEGVGGEGRAVAGLEGEVSRGRRWCEGLDGPKQLRTI